MYTYKANIVRVVDADTVIVDVDLGFDVWVKDITLRLARIDAYETRLSKTTSPEMKAKGLEAKEWLIKSVDNSTQSGEEVKIRTNSRGKYGRWIAELYIGGINVNDTLVNLSYAVYRVY